MSAAGSYDSRIMGSPRNAPPPDRRADLSGTTAARDDETPAGSAAATDATGDPSAATDGIDLSSLSIAGITRRRVGWVTAGLVSAWIVVIFARQTGDAAASAARVDQMSDTNRALSAEVATLEQELQTIKKPEYIAQQAHKYRIGSDTEVPFTLDSSIPAPGPNAPGSSALRLGARDHAMTPLESWLSILFGPAG
jgi:cell division protein FtsB